MTLRLIVFGASLALSCSRAPASVPARAPVRDPAALAREVTQVSKCENATFVGSSKFVYLSTRDGEPQLFIGDRANPNESPRALTALEGGVGDYALSPDRTFIAFSYDPKGADEARIFRVNLDGSGLMDLTPTAHVRRLRPLFARDIPTRLFFEVRKRNEEGIFVFAQDATGASDAKLVFHRPGASGWLRDVRADGRYGLLFQFVSLSERALILADFVTGESRRLYPPEGVNAQISAVHFSSEGDRVFVATDGGGEQALLLALDAASGAEVARYAEKELGHASISEIAVSNERIAVSLFAGNRSMVRLLDARRLTPLQTAKLPLGDGDAKSFSEDGSELMVTWSTPEQAQDIHVVDAATGSVKALRAKENIAPSSLDVSIEQVHSGDGTAIPVNVYRPRGQQGRLPVLVFVHGGPTGSSVLEWTPRTQFFTRSGFAVVEPNIRGSSGFGRSFELADNGAKRVESLRDLESVGRWVASQPWADGSRMVLFGQSYGGYAVLFALSTQPALWRAGIDAYGISDWRTFLKTTNAGTAAMFSKEIGAIETDGALLDALSPLRHAHAIRAPLFVYHGKNDDQVPLNESVQIVDTLRARRIPVEFMVAADEGHGMTKRSTQVEFFSRAARFLTDVFSRNGGASP